MIDDRDRADVVILAAIGDEYEAVLAVNEGRAGHPVACVPP